MISLPELNKIITMIPKNHRSKLIYLFFFYLLALFLELIGIGMIIPILQSVSNSEINSTFLTLLNPFNISFLNQFDLLVYLIFVLVIIFILKFLFYAYALYKQNLIIADIKSTLSTKLFNTYLNKTYFFHLNTNSSILIRNMNEVNYILQVIRSYIMIFVELIVILGIFLLCLYFEPIVLISSFAFIGCIAYFFNRVIQNKASIWGKERQFHEGERLKYLKQAFQLIKELKIFQGENIFSKKFSFHNRESAMIDCKNTVVLGLPRLMLELLAVVGVFILVFSFSLKTQDTSRMIQVLGLFAASGFRLLPSVTRIMNSLQHIKYSLPVVYSIYKQLEKVKVKNILDVNYQFDNLVFNEVSFKYPNSQTNIFKNFNFRITKNKIIGIVGESGSGKTTFLDIMTGVLKVNSGKILINNKYDINDYSENWLKKIGYVPQDVKLIDDTIENNIAFSLSGKNINESLVKSVVNKSNLNDFIDLQEKGLKSSIGELGDLISGGQRQRIGIARALYRNPEILIFDEATNSLDKTSEKSILQEISNLKNNKTIIFITHDLSLRGFFDETYKINNNMLEKVN